MNVGSVWGVLVLVLAGCGTSSDPGSPTPNAGSAGAGAAAGGSSAGASGGSFGGSSAAGASSNAAGAAQALYGSLGTIGSGSLGCGATTCAPHQACCLPELGTDDTCVASLDACAETSSANDPHPQVIGCTSPKDCDGELCCATLNRYSSFPPNLATSCKAQCGEQDTEVCADASECSVSGELCNMGPDYGTCF